MAGIGMHECGEPGCGYASQFPHVVGQHRQFVHGISGSSPTARRKRAQATSPASPPKPVRVIAPKPADLPPGWGEWTPDETQLLRLLSAVWGKDLPGTVDLLRSRTFATIERMPAVQRLAKQERVIAESRRQVLRSI